MPGFHIKQEIMEYLTNAASCGCGQKQQQRNDLTGDTLVANISEILVELMPKEIRNLDVHSFWRKIRECCGSNFSFPLSATNRAG